MPIWVALDLKSKRKCIIVTPLFLENDSLRNYIQAERNDPVEVQNIPFNLFEIFDLLSQK